MMSETFMIILLLVAYGIALLVVFATFVYRNRVKKQLELLSLTLESHIEGNPVQNFSDIEDELLSKIQKQLLQLDNIWTSHYRREKDEKERLNSLISDIAHQIKTPLANIKVYDSLLATSTLSENEKNDFIQKKTNQVQKLEWLMDALVKVSKIETGLIQISRRTQPLGGVLLSAIDRSTLQAETKRIDLVYSLKNDIYVNIDAKWLEEAIYNILDNAVKYSDEGTSVFLSAESLELFVRIDIEDEGRLISPEEYNNIFKRFYRIEPFLKVDGVGLGLYMARDIVNRHGGYIMIEPGKKGNRFSIFLSV